VAVSIEKKGTFSQKKTEKRKLIQQGRPEGLSRLTVKKFLPKNQLYHKNFFAGTRRAWP
jgi:ribosomal protein L13